MAKITAKIITQDSISIMLDGRNYILTNDTHQHYDELREALKKNDVDTIERLIDVPRAINNYGQGKIRVENGVVMCGDKPLHNALTRRLLQQMQEGFNVDPMLKFQENLLENPSFASRQELYEWMEANNNPITEDGHFIAWKRVRPDYKDFYTGTIDNSIGQIVEMDRGEVNDDRYQTCSVGLHFCSESYIPIYHGGSTGHTMILKVNPRDVVSIPADYNNAKGRCCRYEVIGEVGGDLKEYSDSLPAVIDTTQPIDANSYEMMGYGKGETSFRLYSLVTGIKSAKDLAHEWLNDPIYYIHEIERVEIKNATDGTLVETVVDKIDTGVGCSNKCSDCGCSSVITQDSASVIVPKEAWPFTTTFKEAVDSQNDADEIEEAPALDEVLFTKTQAAAILGLSIDKMDTMLTDGAKVERVQRGGKNWVRIKK